MRLVKLKDCCTIKPPKSEARKQLSESDLVSFIPMNNLGINTPFLVLGEDKPLSNVYGSYTYFADNDVLLAKITPCFENGKLGIAKGLTNGIGFGSSEFIVFRAGDGLLPEYLYYFLMRKIFREQGQAVMTGAVGHKRVPKEFIENLEIPLLSKGDQKHVVSLLDQTLSDLKQAFSTVERNLSNTKELFESYANNIFANADEWGREKLGDVCHFVRGPFGGSLKKDIFKSTGFAVYEQQHAINNQFNDIRYYVDEEKFIEMQRFELFTGDLIISCSGTMGKVAIVPEGIEKGIINQALLKLTPSGVLSPKYLKIWLDSRDFQTQIARLSQGAAIKNMASVKILKEISAPIPTLNVQNQIVEDFERLQEKCNKIENIYRTKLECLSNLKESILQKAFSGELKNSKGVAA
ncbi:restriction endonuclease subunit S [Catenovulum sediminis]|uniref:Restriction endonuclease subunit S n=1 Tax=Catenovulum sediminis TaxID=1740262 RepID=A0ABV1RID0_9ALTE